MRKKVFYLLISLLLFTFIMNFVSNINNISRDEIVNKGEINLRDFEFNKGKISQLSGDWEYFNNKILSPDDFVSGKIEPSEFIKVPSKFLKNTDNSFGFGTLRLKIKVPKEPRLYGMKFEYMLSSYKIYVNGKYYGEVGEISKHGNGDKGIYSPYIFEFYASDEIEVIVQTSNFADRISFLKPVYFGLSNDIKKWDFILVFRDISIVLALFMLSIFYINYYLLRLDEKRSLYFSLMCIFFSIRSFFINERIGVRIFQDLSWCFFSKIIYISLFLSFLFLVKYFEEEIKDSIIRKFVKYLELIIYALCMFTLILCSIFEYEILYMFEIIAGITIILILYRSLKLFRSGEKRVFLSLVGVGIFSLVSIIDMFNDFGIIETGYISSIGIFIFFLIQSKDISEKFSKKLLIYENISLDNTNLINKMKDMNESLEMSVKKRTEELEIKTLELEKTNSKLKNLNYYLENLSYIDELTKIPNRRMLFEEIEIQLEIASRNTNRMYIMMIDIDYFKLYNDFYGHLKGDWCLFNVAQTIDKLAYENGIFCARYGGEEFILVGVEKNENDMELLSKMLMEDIDELDITNELSPGKGNVTVSIGGYSSEINKKMKLMDLIGLADDLLYEAKKAGRNNFRLKKE